MLRLPSSLLGLQTASRYCPGESACAWAAGDRVVVELNVEGAVEDWAEDGEGWLASIAPARSELAAGGRRLLYLAWLLSVEAGELADEEPEPEVPPGLKELGAPLQALVDSFASIRIWWQRRLRQASLCGRSSRRLGG